jgi:hypothetical protein
MCEKGLPDGRRRSTAHCGVLFFGGASNGGKIIEKSMNATRTVLQSRLFFLRCLHDTNGFVFDD